MYLIYQLCNVILTTNQKIILGYIIDSTTRLEIKKLQPQDVNKKKKRKSITKLNYFTIKVKINQIYTLGLLIGF